MNCEMPYIDSEKQCADILTKAFVLADKFDQARRLVAIYLQDEVPWTRAGAVAIVATPAMSSAPNRFKKAKKSRSLARGNPQPIHL